MKKILIATTALVATAGVAAAEVKLSGYARFGVQYNEGTAATGTAAQIAAATAAKTATAAAVKAGATANAAKVKAGTYAAADVAAQAALVKADDEAAAALDAIDGTADATNVVSRARINLSASTTTDAGVNLSVFQRWHTEENSNSSGLNGARYALSYGDFTVRAGNIIGVIESTPNLYMNTNSAGVGLEGNGFHSIVLNNAAGSWGWTAYSSSGAGATNGVEVIYSANGLRLHAHDTDGSTAYGASYAMGDVTVAAGYEDLDAGGSVTLITAGMNIGNGWVALAHGINESAAGVDTDKTAIKAGYDVAPGMNVYGFVASETAGDASGVGMSYDLGGGASFDAGYTNTASSKGVLSAGVFFTF